MKTLLLSPRFHYTLSVLIVVCSLFAIAAIHVHAQVTSVPSPTLCDNGNVNNPSSYPTDFTTSLYSQSSYYRQGSYAAGYSQGSYSTYGQGSYSYGQGSYVTECLVCGGDSYSQSSYFTCPSGYHVFQGRSCCLNEYYSVIDTNGSDKGGRVEQCAMPDAPSSEPPPAEIEITDMWIKAEPSIVRFDGSSTISWDGGNAESCTVTGYALNESTTEGNKTVTNFQGESVYTLTCTLGSKTKSMDTTVKVLPRSQET